MSVMSDLDIDITDSIDVIVQHLDIMSNEQLSALMDRIGFELLDRDSENLLRLEQAEQDYLNAGLDFQNGELSA